MRKTKEEKGVEKGAGRESLTYKGKVSRDGYFLEGLQYKNGDFVCALMVTKIQFVPMKLLNYSK